MKQLGRDVVIAGKYQLKRHLASGGMGIVWVAMHLKLAIPVAIKFPRLSADPREAQTLRLRFDREAKIAALLRGPNMVEILDYDVEEGLPYIVMELLQGETLGQRLRRLGRLSIGDTIAILAQTSEGLFVAHRHGIVHRCIKPSDLFLITLHSGQESVKLLDFCIAHEAGPLFLTERIEDEYIVGSPEYMSPEQIRGAWDIDFRTDLWSLGVVAFECITGRLPFRGADVGDTMAMILADPLPSVENISSDLKPELDNFFARALARDRRDRFQSANEMTQGLIEVARSQEPRGQEASHFELEVTLPANTLRWRDRLVLPPELLEEVYAAIISADLELGVLLSDLPPPIRAHLPSAGTPTGTLRQVLSTLNRMRLADGTIPFALVLRSACALTTLRQEAAVFGRALHAIGVESW